MAMGIRILLTILFGIVLLFLQFGLRNSWLTLFTWQRGPVALVSITYYLAEPYRTIAFIGVLGLLTLVWLSSFRRSVTRSSHEKAVKNIA